MKPIEIVRELEGKSNLERFNFTIAFLKDNRIEYSLHKYSTGTNIIVETSGRKNLGIGSHYDVVKNSPGANDNASAIVVSLGILLEIIRDQSKNLGFIFYFFEEEERGLKGSKAYVAEFGIRKLVGFLNMEMVGMGDEIALWPLNNLSTGSILTFFEESARCSGIISNRYDKIITHTADHVPFQHLGLESFTITSISKKDREIAYHYYKAQEFEVDKEVLYEIISEAPIFRNYHKPTDTSEFLSEESLIIVKDLIIKTARLLDESF